MRVAAYALAGLAAAAPVFAAGKVKVTLFTTSTTTICPCEATSAVSLPSSQEVSPGSTSPSEGSPTASSGSSYESPSTTPDLTTSDFSTPIVPVTTTEITTIYTTICDATSVITTSGTTTVSSYSTTSTLTSVITSTIPLTYTKTAAPSTPVESATTTSKPSSSTKKTSSPSSPVGSPTGPVTTTEITTIYTTVCDATSVVTTSGTTTISSYSTTSTLTSVITSTIPLTYTKTAAPSTPVESATTTSKPSSTTKKTSGPSSPVGSTTVTTPPVVTGSTDSGSISYTIVSSTPIYRNNSCFTSTLINNGTTTIVTSTYSSKSTFVSGTHTSSKGSHPVGTSTTTKTGSIITPSRNATTPLYSKTLSSSYSSKTSSSSSSSTNTCPTPTPTSEICIPCAGQPGNDPDEWCGYDVNTDFYKHTPITCRTREYFFTVTNTTIAPDGINRLGLLVNGQFPGPALEASWGDTIVVHLTNGLQNNGTSLHFHGMRQFITNEMDGVPSITQCALAPGDSMTYKFVATNYGSSWYHSHWGLQTYDGILGPLIIKGPTSKEYDTDMGAVVLQDWNHVSVNEIYGKLQDVATGTRSSPTLDTGLINGLNTWTANGVTTGSRWSTTLTPGKAHLFRLVNCAIQATFKFSIDGHKFWVISSDFVPIVPYETTVLSINIGQRYDIIVVADQGSGNFWMRAENQLACSPLTNSDDIKAVVNYEGSPVLTPTTSANADLVQGACVDEPAASLVPVVSMNAGDAEQTILKDVVIGAGPNTPNLFKWTLSGTTFNSNWGDPTLLSLYENGTVPDYSGNLAIEVKSLGEWVYLIIESQFPVPHPIHLHGHDFFLLAAGTGMYSSQDVDLNLSNPPRRDVVMMPAQYPALGPPSDTTGGHVVVAWEADNPGAWLVHCHVGWHAEMGFALQVIEDAGCAAQTVTDPMQMKRVCKNWNAYSEITDLVQSDSGI